MFFYPFRKHIELHRDSEKRNKASKGFTLIEVMVAAALLAGGLLSIVAVFPYGLAASQRAEDVTKASLLAQSIFEGIKSGNRDFPIIPGMDDVIVPLPGNAYDDDTHNVTFNPERRGMTNPFDLNRNNRPDKDYDGMPEFDALAEYYGLPGIVANGIDDDGDGIVDDTGDSGVARSSRGAIPPSFAMRAPDGNIFYDPEPHMDEEFPDGKDNDNDGLIDEDVRLASVRVLGSNLMLPLLAGDGVDNDGDGEDHDGNPLTPAMADGIDNNNDGRIDEGIDEEIWDGIDNDGDGLIDEDVSLARFPFSPSQFPEPYDRYGWQLRVGFVPDNGRWGIVDVNGDGIPDLGDGIDNDGDGLVDEELPDGIDMDFPVTARRPGQYRFLRAYTQTPRQDGLVDEDAIAAPLPHWRRVEVLITWGGDGIDNDGDFTKVDPRGSNPNISYGEISWGIDEERRDGIDNDLDGLIDEDCYEHEFVLVGFINMREPTLSFTHFSGQPRGIISPLTIGR